jgi:hypothetical protein|tara:strand:- start:27551 stop:27862 length:312 start_codon:yes stop_codon:yes gene_type:complete
MEVSQNQPIKIRFLQFHLANPHVYDKLRELSIFAKNGGAKRIGIALLFERLRWFSMFETQGDMFKLNNDYRALYARMLMNNVPQLDGFFELRSRSIYGQSGEN